MLTKGLCADLAPFGIQANAIAPGYFATKLTQALVDDNEFSAWVQARAPARPIGSGGGPCRRAPVPRFRRFDIRQRPDPYMSTAG